MDSNRINADSHNWFVHLQIHNLQIVTYLDLDFSFNKHISLRCRSYIVSIFDPVCFTAN